MKFSELVGILKKNRFRIVKDNCSIKYCRKSCFDNYTL